MNALEVVIIRSAIEKAKHLTDREREVLILRFGLTGGVQMTLQDIGDKWGITRERVRQIEAKAIRKIKIQ